jgi:hypothetical protein
MDKNWQRQSARIRNEHLQLHWSYSAVARQFVICRTESSPVTLHYSGPTSDKNHEACQCKILAFFVYKMQLCKSPCGSFQTLCFIALKSSRLSFFKEQNILPSSFVRNAITGQYLRNWEITTPQVPLLDCKLLERDQNNRNPDTELVTEQFRDTMLIRAANGKVCRITKAFLQKRRCKIAKCLMSSTDRSHTGF